jgi:hypothetical protein
MMARRTQAGKAAGGPAQSAQCAFAIDLNFPNWFEFIRSKRYIPMLEKFQMKYGCVDN